MIKEQYKNILPALQKQLRCRNIQEVPRIRKVVLNSGVGRYDEKEKELISDVFSVIAGQHVAPVGARKSIASFKLREGMVVGYRATLRGKRMYDFLDRMVHIAIPRTRDFRGLRLSTIDERGNLNIGFREHVVFPEMIGRDARPVFGIEVTVVTKSRNREESIALFRSLGFPLQKTA